MRCIACAGNRQKKSHTAHDDSRASIEMFESQESREAGWLLEHGKLQTTEHGTWPESSVRSSGVLWALWIAVHSRPSVDRLASFCTHQQLVTFRSSAAMRASLRERGGAPQISQPAALCGRCRALARQPLFVCLLFRIKCTR